MKRFTINIGAVFLLLLLLLNVSCTGDKEETSVALMEKTEQEALYLAIQGFVGNWWNGSELYPDPCGWTPIQFFIFGRHDPDYWLQGVSCDFFDGFWYVTGINIGPVQDNSLICTRNAMFSQHLFELRHLRRLSFFNCFISPHERPISIPIQNWEKLAESLESLEFRLNPGLIGQIPPIFGRLTNLESLVLLENGLSGELPMNLGNLHSLKRLILAGNQFSGRVPDCFGGLTQLLIYDSSRNSLSGTLPFTFGELISLLKLDLSENLLEGKLPEELGNLKNLTLLDLRSNKFSGGLTQSLQEMVSLQELVLSNNPIGGDLMGIVWEKLQNLIVLDLSNMNLTGKIPETMAELKRLRFLGLNNNNNLSGNISPKFEAMPCLSTLYLNGNNLTGELKFSEWFYGKMGRRFGAWNNPNLCYPVELMSTGHVPHGLKPCQMEESISDTN